MDQHFAPETPAPPPRPCVPKPDPSGLRVPFAACGDGVVRHVEQITSPRQGPFICLGCEERLTLRLPKVNRRHFAHRSDSRCSGETALHLYAKLLLLAVRRVTLPALILRDGGLQEVVFEGGEFALDSVKLEQSEGTFQPDAMVTTGADRRAVEFKVAHAVDTDKQTKVAHADCPMIEIDLSGVRWRKLDQAELDDQILHLAPRHWVYHPDRERAELLLSERVNREKKAKGERLRWHIAERPQKPFIDSEWVSQVMTDLQDAELDYLVGAKTTLGHWFTVRPQLWQAGLVHALIYKPSIGFSAGGDIRIRGEWPNERHLESVLPTWMLRTDLSNYTPKALAAAGYSRETFGSASQAVVEYLFHLFTDRQAVIWAKDEQRFYVDPDLHHRLHHRHELQWKVRSIAEDARHPDPDGISRRWMRRYNVDGRNPWAVAGEGGNHYRALLERVDAIRDMTRAFREVPIVDDLCGLPFQEWRDGLRRKREEKEAAEQKRIEDEKAKRLRNFGIAATNGLKDDADAWLASKMIDGVPIAEWASVSDDRYWKAFDHIERAETDRRRRVQAAEAAEDLRKRLTTEAKKAFRDPDRANLFLNSAHPKLAGRRPIEACETEGDLKVVLALLPKA